MTSADGMYGFDFTKFLVSEEFIKSTFLKKFCIGSKNVSETPSPKLSSENQVKENYICEIEPEIITKLQDPTIFGEIRSVLFYL